MSYGSGGSAGPGEVFGATVPRLWTPPLRELTPETSYGFDLNSFARDVCMVQFDPWEEWLSIHAGELLPDGRPRFRVLLILVARQNGKTTWAKVLILYWMFMDRVPLVLGTSTDRSYAKKTWAEVVDMAKANEYLSAELGPAAVRLTISEEALTNIYGSEYSFAANNGRAGRSRTIHRALIDEVREHRSLDAWGSITGAMNAVPYGQVVAISNQGDDSAVLLDALRDPAVAFIETGEGDPRLGLFEYSSPPGSDPTDLEALAQANPNLGRRVDRDALLGAARRAKAAGGLELASYRTEVMCQRVALLDPAIDPDLWQDAGNGAQLDLAEHRDKVALCLDVSVDGMHASLVAAALVDGLVHVDVVKAWSGFGCTKELRADLPDIVKRVRPRVLGWFPNGPAAAIAADMNDQPRSTWQRLRMKIGALTSETTAVCMALPELVKGGEVRHGRDPMLDAHVASAQRLKRGDGWVYTRRGTGPVDGVYAMAGAVHLARTLPPPPPKLYAA